MAAAVPPPVVAGAGAVGGADKTLSRVSFVLLGPCNGADCIPEFAFKGMRQSQRGPAPCRSFWSGLGTLFHGGASDSKAQQKELQQPPPLPEAPWKKKGRDREQEEEEETYVPEVNALATLSDRVVKEISIQGSTEVIIEDIVKTVWFIFSTCQIAGDQMCDLCPTHPVA